MEWVLQVVDEFDDAVGALRHSCLKVSCEVGLFWNGTRALLTGVGSALKTTVRERPPLR